jgi:hypothetical protein
MVNARVNAGSGGTSSDDNDDTSSAGLAKVHSINNQKALKVSSDSL